MKLRSLMPVICAALCTTAGVSGCSGGNTSLGATGSIAGQNAVPSRKTGTVQFSVRWPGSPSRTIPLATQTLRVRLTVYDVPFADGTFVREVTIPAGTQPTPISGVPVGNARLQVSAFGGAPNSGTTSSNVLALFAQTVLVSEGDNKPVINLEAAKRFVESVQLIPEGGGTPVDVPVITEFTQQYFSVDFNKVYELRLLPRTESGAALDFPFNEVSVGVNFGEIRLLNLDNTPVASNVVTGQNRVRLKLTFADSGYNELRISLPSKLVSNFDFGGVPDTFYIGVYKNAP